MARFDDDVYFTKAIICGEGAITTQDRTSILRQDPVVRFPVPLANLRVWDAPATNLPTSASSDDLGLIAAAAWGTNPIVVNANDCKAATVTRYAFFELIVPECFDVAETLEVAITGGMSTTIADTSVFVDLEAYLVSRLSITGVGSDLCLTAQQSINSLTFAEKVFAIDSSGLAVGDRLLCRVKIASIDAATGTAVIPTITAIDVLADIVG